MPLDVELPEMEDEWSDPEYWKRIAPGLHCGDAAWQEEASAAAAAAAKGGRKAWRKASESELRAEGVATAGGVVEPPLCAALADAVERLHEAGLPASFVLLYDEAWAAVSRASAAVAASSGGNECNFDVLAWRINPGAGDAGFAPHRDRQPDDAAATFREDGSAKYVTAWVPFVDAVPENSCLYCVPAQHDPGYLRGDDESGAVDPLQAALPSKEAFRNIRALPARAGDAVVFTHRIIHWGSAGRAGYPTPRVNVSLGCTREGEDYEPPYLSRDANLPFPPVPLRSALVAAQMLLYHERFSFGRREVARFHRVFTAHAAEFHPAYRRKVTAEFVAATKEADERARKARVLAEGEAAGAPLGGGDEEEDEDEDALEDALDAMLDARAEGWSDYEDDYDNLDGDDAGGLPSDEDDDDDDDDEEPVEGNIWAARADSEAAQKLARSLVADPSELGGGFDGPFGTASKKQQKKKARKQKLRDEADAVAAGRVVKAKEKSGKKKKKKKKAKGPVPRGAPAR